MIGESYGYVQLIDVALLLMLIATAIGAVVARNLVVSTVILSIFSLLMALMYMIMGAPDVAITEAAIGAGVSTLLFLAVILLVGEHEEATPKVMVALLVVVFIGGALVYATLGLPAFGDPDAPANLHLAPYYITQTAVQMDIPNVVTGILASFRGYDTMGEVFVVFTAGISVLMLLQKPAKK